MKKPANTTEEVNRNPLPFVADAVGFGASNAIGMQEHRGQLDFVLSDVLPVRMQKEDRTALIKAGIRFLDPVKGDPLFVYVALPPGWRKEPTDHSMWSHLVDNKGRKRGSIFYKAAFYDRDAHMGMNCRFQVRKDYELEMKQRISVAQVWDRGQGPNEVKIFETEPEKMPSSDTRDDRLRGYGLADEQVAKALAWLNERYPDSSDPSAYWD